MTQVSTSYQSSNKYTTPSPSRIRGLHFQLRSSRTRQPPVSHSSRTSPWRSRRHSRPAQTTNQISHRNKRVLIKRCPPGVRLTMKKGKLYWSLNASQLATATEASALISQPKWRAYSKTMRAPSIHRSSGSLSHAKLFESSTYFYCEHNQFIIWNQINTLSLSKYFN